ncbi:ABC transporter ATP-binding protein [soil metagenome]
MQDRSVVRRGISLLGLAVRTHRRPFTVSVVGATLFAIMAVLATVVLGEVTDRLIVPAFAEDREGRGISGATVAGAVAALMVVAVLRAAGVVLRRYWGSMTFGRMQVTWRRRITDRYLDVPLAFHRSRPAGELLAHADADVEAATMAIQPLPFSLGVIIIIVFATASLAIVDPMLLAVGLCLFPSLALLSRAYARRVEAPAAAVQARVGDVSAVVHESFDGALVVKTLGLEDDEVRRLATAADALRTERIRVGRLRALFEPALDVIPNVGVIALLAVGAWRVSTGDLSTGELVQAMALFGILAFPMRVVGFLLEEIPRSVVAAERIATVLDADVAPAPAADARRTLPPGQLGVELDHLSFGYGDQAVLRDVSATVTPGEVVALVGSTGSGKSTLCTLLARLADPVAGAIRLGGVDLRALDPAVLRAEVALVFQETFLFADTVRENLAVGVDVSDDDLAWATGVARADGFLTALPHGFDQVVGERGITLSGGQRQRVALARALLHRPRLLVLDDATSAIDPVVEAQILAGLRQQLHTTTVIVAQRLSTIALADRVLYLDGGRIVASGSHHELLDLPAYRALVTAYDIPRLAATDTTMVHR